MVENPNRIRPDQVTKPIQLLAAWLVGLIAIDSAFLTAAGLIAKPDWAAAALVLAAILNVPIFLVCLFLLQTKFRPEMQEDSYYSRHLERRFSDQTKKMETFTALNIRSSPVSSAFLPHEDAMHTSAKKNSNYVELPISINDLLPNYKEIKKKLLEIGVISDDTFGTTSEFPTVPPNFVVAVGNNFPVKEARKIIRALKPMGLDGVGVNDEPYGLDRIYVGAYSYEDHANFLPVDTDDFEKVMSEKTGSKTFFDIIRKYEYDVPT